MSVGCEERAEIRRVLSLNLSHWPQMAGKSIEDIARRIERSCNNAAIDSAAYFGIMPSFAEPRYIGVYSAECARIISNISVETAFNSYLVELIASESVDPNNVASLKNEQLCPQAAQVERDEITLRLNQKTEIKVSRRHTCKKCGGNETTKIEYQSAASDEASSHSIRCICCGNVWRK